MHRRRVLARAGDRAHQERWIHVQHVTANPLEAELRHTELDRRPQERRARAALRRGEKFSEPGGDALRVWHAADVALIPDPLRFRETELSQQKERLARRPPPSS